MKLRAVERDRRASAQGLIGPESAEGLQLLERQVEAVMQVGAVDAVELGADVNVSRQARDAEQRAGGAFAVRLVEHPLVVQKRRRLDEKARKRAHDNIVKAVLLVSAPARVGHPGEHGDALGVRQRPAAPPPVLRLALDALAVGEVFPRAAPPVDAVRREAEPHPFGDHPGLVHDLQRQGVPVTEGVVIQRRAAAADHHRAGQAPHNLKQLQGVGFLIVTAAAAALRSLAGGGQIGRVAKHQLGAVPVKLRQIRMAAAVDQLHRTVALKCLDGAPVQIDADAAQRRRLSLHDAPVAQVRLDESRMGRHQGDQRLAQS